MLGLSEDAVLPGGGGEGGVAQVLGGGNGDVPVLPPTGIVAEQIQCWEEGGLGGGAQTFQLDADEAGVGTPPVHPSERLQRLEALLERTITEQRIHTQLFSTVIGRLGMISQASTKPQEALQPQAPVHAEPHSRWRQRHSRPHLPQPLPAQEGECEKEMSADVRRNIAA